MAALRPNTLGSPFAEFQHFRTTIGRLAEHAPHPPATQKKVFNLSECIPWKKAQIAGSGHASVVLFS